MKITGMRVCVFMRAFLVFVGLLFVTAPAIAQDNSPGDLRDLLERLLPNDQQPQSEGTRHIERRVPFGNQDMQLSFAPLVAEASPSVVNVYAARTVQQRSPFSGDPFFDQFFGRQFSGPPRVQSSLGSGVIVDESGLVVTNNHVIEGADEVKIALADGREFESTIVLRDESSDLAVLRINDRGPFKQISFGNSDSLLTGDLVLAIGNPFGVGQTITSGIVSAVARNRVGVSDFGFFIQTDAAINPGNSGGALIDMQGRLVGINTAIFSRSGGSNGIGFAIPSNMVRAVVAQAESGSGAFERPYIGATFENVTPQIAEALGLSRPQGALVNNVDENGPAEKAGLQSGDVLMAVNGVPIENPDALGYRLATLGPGGVAEIDLLSRGKRKAVTIRLEKAPETVSPRETTIYGRNPFAGANIANLSPRLARRLRLGDGETGVVITEIERGSLADRTGFAPGDILMNINGRDIETVEDASDVIEQGERSWRFTVNRRGRMIRQFLRF